MTPLLGSQRLFLWNKFPQLSPCPLLQCFIFLQPSVCRIHASIASLTSFLQLRLDFPVFLFPLRIYYRTRFIIPLTRKHHTSWFLLISSVMYFSMWMPLRISPYHLFPCHYIRRRSPKLQLYRYKYFIYFNYILFLSPIYVISCFLIRIYILHFLFIH